MTAAPVATTTDRPPAASTAQSRPAPLRHGGPLVGIAVLGLVVYYLLTHLQGTQGQVALLVALWTVAVTGLNIVQGLGGYPSLAQASFYGGGAYLSTIFLHSGMPMAVAALLAVAAVTGAGLVVSLVFARTRGQYFAIGTLFFGAVVTLVLNNATSLTGGPNGIVALDPLHFLSLTMHSVTSYYYLLLLTLALVLVAIINLNRSRIGRAWRAIREDALAAEAMGIPTNRLRLLAFAVGAGIAGFAGCLFAAWQQSVFPGNFDVPLLITLYAMVVLGDTNSCISALMAKRLKVPVYHMVASWLYWRLLYAPVGDCLRYWARLS